MSKELARTVETAPSYGDLSELNTSRMVLESVGRDALVQMVGDLLEMLQTSCAVYEKNGDYALGIFSSHWCRFLDQASRKLCGTDDNREALQCGKWLCHESCWRDASQIAVETGQPADVECNGGIHIHAVPIKAGDEVVGSINFGYGDPPKEPTRLREIAAKYQVSVEELWEQAHEYESRPEFVIDLAKKHLMTSAKLIGEIVERKRAEDAADEAGEQFRTLIQNIHDGVYRLDREARFTFVNDLIVERSGRSREWYIGRSFLDVVVSEDHQRLQEIFAATMRGETTQPYETAYRRASGDVMYIEVNSSPVFEGDEAVGLLGVSRDITERKRSEEALRDSEKKYHHLFENLVDAAFLADAETGLIVETNRQGEELLGRTRGEIIGMHQSDLHPPDTAEHYKQVFAEHVQKGRTVDTEVVVARKDGTVVPVQISATVMTIGEHRFMLGLFRDITERKQAEAELHIKNGAIVSAISGIAIGDMEGRLSYVNPAFLKMWGYDDAKEVVGRSGLEFWQSRDKAAEAMQTSKEEGAWFGKLVAVKKDGRLMDIQASVSAIMDEQGSIKGIIASFVDITEKKRVDEALKNSKHELDIRNRIAEIFLTVPDEEVYGDVLQVVLEAMDSKYGVFGYIDENGALVVPSMTRHIWDKCQVPDKKIVYPPETWGDSAWPRAIREKKTLYSNEPSTLTPEGHVAITRNIVVPMIHAEDVVGIFHVANKDTDYTEDDIRLLETIGGAVAPVLNARLQRDRATQSLRESEQRFRAIFEQAGETILVTNTEGQIVEFNDKAHEALGYTREEFQALGIADIEAIESPEEVKAHIEEVTREGSVTFESKHRTKTGEIQDVAVTVTLVDASGTKFFLSTCHDITERKQATNALKESIAGLQEMVNQLANGPAKKTPEDKS